MDGSRTWGSEGWTILQTGYKKEEGIILMPADLTGWNITLKALERIGTKLNSRPGPEPFLLCCKKYLILLITGCSDC